MKNREIVVLATYNQTGAVITARSKGEYTQQDVNDLQDNIKEAFSTGEEGYMRIENKILKIQDFSMFEIYLVEDDD